jgi:uncharacterized protein (DUF169 family)
MNFSELESTLVRSLALTHRPVAVTFLDAPPAGVPEFTGEVPSGCTFWQLASEGRSFYTSAKDHYNCAVGCHTHNIALPKERESELMSTVGFMVEVGYIKMEEVPGIPRMEKASKHVVYAPLADAKIDPAVVIVRGAPGKLMLLQEAGYRAGVRVESPLLARPTCMAIPAALTSGTTMSSGCVGNRVYTQLDDNELYVMVPGADLARIAGQLQTILAANAILTDYHTKRKSELTHV